MQQGAEVRWIVLGLDGGHVTLGRHREPTEDAIRRAEAALRAAGTSGWLARCPRRPRLGRLPAGAADGAPARGRAARRLGGGQGGVPAGLGSQCGQSGAAVMALGIGLAKRPAT